MIAFNFEGAKFRLARVPMKIFGILWLLAWTTTAGEISERYWAEKKADTNVLQKMQKHKEQQMSLRGFVLTNGPGQFEFSPGNVITNHGVTEIGIERTRCFGRCPDYTFVVSADGRCRYEGGEYAQLKGKKTGRASLVAFHRVGELCVS